MSLRGFHILFITASVLLALGLAKWCLQQQHSLAAVGAAGVAMGLIAYEAWFLRKTRKMT